MATLNAGGAGGNLSVTVAADAGFDTVDLTLGSGNDHVVIELPGTVHGGGGDDTFVVRSPNVSLTGGSGNNLFDLREATQGSSGFVPSTVTITDFTAGDRILLPEGLSFNPSALHQISTSGQDSLANIAYSFWIGTSPESRPMVTDTLVRYSFSAHAQSDNAGLYLLVHDDDPALNQNDLFVHLVGVPTNAALMLDADGYLTLV